MSVSSRSIFIILNVVLVSSAFLIGRATAPEPRPSITCERYENVTLYRNYCEGEAVPTECQPTGRCGLSSKCSQEKACGYLCPETVCALVNFTLGKGQYQFEP